MWIKTTLRTLAVLFFATPVFAQGDCFYELECPPEVTLSCSDSVSPDNTGLPAYVTDCESENLVITWSDVTEGDECLSVINRTFSLMLEGAELAVCEQVIVVEDNEAPYFPNLPQDLVIQCGEELPEIPECPAVDDCSGIASCETFVVQTGSPVDSCVLTLPAGPGPDWAVWLPGLTLLDDPHFVWTEPGTLVSYFNGTAHITGMVRNISDPSLAFEVDIWMGSARNWEDWSALGRSYKNDYGTAEENYLDWTYYEMVDVYSRLIGVDALEGSELELYHMPSDYFYGFQCGIGANNRNTNEGISGWFTFEGQINGEPVEGHGDIAADKACTSIEVNPDCDSNAGYTIYWRATDNCNNTATVSQSVSSQDNEDPVFVSFPEDVTITCTELPYVSESPVASDDCPGEVSVDGPVDEIIPGECPVAYIIERSWTATDVCGNFVRRVQLIAVIDEEDPFFIDVPEIVELSCVIDMETIYAEAGDDCTEVTIDFTDVELDDEQYCSGSVERTYIATDICGNTATATQLILLVDDQTPIFTAFPEDVLVSCGEIPELYPSSIQYEDNCPDPEYFVVQEQVEGECPNSYFLIREYFVVDACGNTATEIWTIEVTDSTPPVIFGTPADAGLNCGDPIPDAIVFATDNCDEAPVVSVTGETELLDCGYIFVRTWTATDACGNSSSTSQTITLTDINDPEFIFFPEDVTISCSDLPYDSQAPVAEDDCLGEVIISEPVDEIFPGDCPVAFTIERSWEAVDGCGNTSRLIQFITVLDEEAPVFTEVPEVVELSCVSDLDVVYASVSDDCSEVELDYVDVELDDEEYCIGSVSRIYTATDICGNTATATQLILVVDDETPIFTSFPEDLTVSCNQIPELYPSSIQYSDNCPDPEFFVIQEQISGDCPDSYTLLREYAVVDVCGNTASQTWTIQVVDNEAPTLLGVPSDISLSCSDEIPDAIVFATDECDDNPVVALTAETEELECGELFIRTWTATDACGNQSSASQVITIIDEDGPIFLNFPNDLVVECGSDIPDFEVTADDLCSEVLSFEMIEEIEPGACPAEYTLFRIYTAIDACGNTSIATLTIDVVDTQAPVFNEFPEIIEVSCDLSFPSDFGVSALDACGEVSLSFEDSAEEFECGMLYERIWTATDACGNSAQVVQILDSVDDEAPTVISFPEDATVECNVFDADVELNIVVTDNCANEIVVEMNEEIIPGECENSFLYIRNYFWSDGCGNGTSRTYTVTVVDSTPPVLLGVPADISIGCLDPIPDAIVFATDNCTDQLEVSLTAETEELECGFLFIRTWSTTDECGNTSTASQTITVVDDTDPYFDFLPEDLFLECGDPIPPVADVQVLDDCDEEPILFVADEFEGDGCPQTLIRVFRAADCAGNFVIYAQYIYFEDPNAPDVAPEDEASFNWQVLPNQTEEYIINLKSSENTRCSVEVLDLGGRRIESIQEMGMEADVDYQLNYNTSYLTPGIYLIHVYSDTMSETRKIAVMR